MADPQHIFFKENGRFINRLVNSTSWENIAYESTRTGGNIYVLTRNNTSNKKIEPLDGGHKVIIIPSSYFPIKFTMEPGTNLHVTWCNWRPTDIRIISLNSVLSDRTNNLKLCGMIDDFTQRVFGLIESYFVHDWYRPSRVMESGLGQPVQNSKASSAENVLAQKELAVNAFKKRIIGEISISDYDKYLADDFKSYKEMIDTMASIFRTKEGQGEGMMKSYVDHIKNKKYLEQIKNPSGQPGQGGSRRTRHKRSKRSKRSRRHRK